MAASKRVINFLDKKGAKYEVISHRKVFTAFDKAKTLKLPEKMVAKTLVVKFNTSFAVVLIPAGKNLDKKKFKKVIDSYLKKKGEKQAKKIDFAKEAWIKKNLKGAKVGAVPPFGNLWKLPTFLDKSLVNNQKIVVSAGDYSWSIKISPAAFVKVVSEAGSLFQGTFSEARK
jgi:Ala-tRNA(Pro) deacylase